MKKLVLLALLAASPAVADTEQHRVARCVDILDRMTRLDDPETAGKNAFTSRRDQAWQHLIQQLSILQPWKEIEERTKQAQELYQYSKDNCTDKELVPELASCIAWIDYFPSPEKQKLIYSARDFNDLAPLNHPSITEELPFPYENLSLWRQALAEGSVRLKALERFKKIENSSRCIPED